MPKNYEIEIKSLLGSKENADALRQKVMEREGKLFRQEKQLNHYFTYTDIKKFHQDLLSHIPEEQKEIFSDLMARGKNFSIRTRQTNDKVMLIVKVSIDDHTSSNAVSRREFDAIMNMSLDELDQLLLKAGLEYQAKWSREREEYKLNDTSVCIDRNAGYGYLAEFEKVVNDDGIAAETKQSLLILMDELGVGELQQDRLERMFSFYNSHWPEYYGTDKVFNID
nr:CYTH domain protein [uncultured bacterium]